MVPTVLVSTLAAVVVLTLAWAVLRHERGDETERFHRASAITSAWAAPGPQIHGATHDPAPAMPAVLAAPAVPAVPAPPAVPGMPAGPALRDVPAPAQGGEPAAG